MIISFSVENWASFRDQVTLSMIASKERQHGDRVPRLNKYQTRVLPIAAIYGGNASGKTNLFEALSFARNLVVEGTRLGDQIPIEPFRLRVGGVEQLSRFTFELLVDETIYEFGFSVTREAVLEEKLVEVMRTSERTLYDRREGKATFGSPLNKDERLEHVFEGTQDNQLFLTNSVSQRIDRFAPVYNWFKDSLTLISPITPYWSFERLLDEEQSLHKKLSQLDTGIARLQGEEIPFESVPIPEELRTDLKKTLSKMKEGMTIEAHGGPLDQVFLFTLKDGELTAKKPITVHQKSDGTEVEFEIFQESDGTRRVMELLPAFLAPTARVYVIDEVDRSLHTLLTRTLLEEYLTSCSPETRKQMLLTTHDALLMDQRLLRRDEIWVTERDAAGASTLFAFSEYKDVRNDKDIRKSYLQGRLGGIPHILLEGSLR